MHGSWVAREYGCALEGSKICPIPLPGPALCEFHSGLGAYLNILDAELLGLVW
jgi:hypothetical protein